MAHPKSQHEAFLRGKSHYWTGKACKHGHVAFRFAANGACMECRRLDQYARYMRKKNGEETRGGKDAKVRKSYR